MVLSKGPSLLLFSHANTQFSRGYLLKRASFPLLNDCGTFAETHPTEYVRAHFPADRDAEARSRISASLVDGMWSGP